MRLPAVLRPRRRTLGGGAGLVLLALGAFLILYARVLVGHRALLGGDILYAWLPWKNAAGAHLPSNNLIADPVLEFMPWHALVGQALAHGHLPLWNPYALNGVPLLGNDISAALSPFTLLSLPFNPAHGMSLAMLAKMWVAGIGMAMFLRTLGARPVAMAAGGIAYATSSFVAIWLAWPQADVAAWMPFAFAGTEWFLRSGRRLALAVVAVAVAFQLLGGNAETSLHVGAALALYAVVRLAGLHAGRLRAAAGLVVAAVTGALLAGLQLVPFLAVLRQSTLVDDRSAARIGFAHLGASAISTWLMPDAAGNPAIGLARGHAPNFNESTGFAGVGMLVLAPLGVWWLWRRSRSAAVALAGVGVAAVLAIYGPLTPLTGRLPGLDVSPSFRILVVACFVVPALGGMGVDALLSISWGRLRPHLGMPLLAAAGAGIAALVAAGLVLARRGAGVTTMLPSVHHYIGFWIAVALVSLGTAAALLLAAVVGGRGRHAAFGFGVLALVEGILFAYPFNPRLPLSDEPPASAAIGWLQAHAGDATFTGIGSTFFPESSVSYRLRDVRVYDNVVLTDRVRSFWTHADPGYSDLGYYTLFQRPGVSWLAAAGVAYVMSPPDQVVPGTQPVASMEGVVIARVPGAHAFAYPATATDPVPSIDAALRALAGDAPPGTTVVESTAAPAGPAQVTVTARDAGSADLTVDASAATTVVVQQSFAPGWVARVDGREVPIDAANVLLQAVPVPAGRHTVTLRYEPSSVGWGFLTSAAGLLALAAILAGAPLLRRLRRRDRTAPVPAQTRSATSSSD